LYLYRSLLHQYILKEMRLYFGEYNLTHVEYTAGCILGAELELELAGYTVGCILGAELELELAGYTVVESAD